MATHVNSHNKSRHERVMDGMFRDRKRVFIDRLKWNVPAFGFYEIDQFDGDEAEYAVICEQGSEKHLASMRILKTDRPHLLGEVFPMLCDTGVPTGAEYRELTRLCFSPDLGLRQCLKVRNHLFTSLVEYALANGIAGYTGVMGMAVYQQVLSLGWRCTPLGLPRQIDGEMVAAILAHVEPDTLDLFRKAGTYDSGEMRFAEAA